MQRKDAPRRAIDAHGSGPILGWTRGARSVRGVAVFRFGRLVLNMTNSGFFPVLICSICRKRVKVESSMADEKGDAIHEECYVSRLTVKTRERPGFMVLRKVNKTPALASCEKCQRKFFTPANYFNDPNGAEEYLHTKFDLHACSEEGKTKQPVWNRWR